MNNEMGLQWRSLFGNDWAPVCLIFSGSCFHNAMSSHNGGGATVLFGHTTPGRCLCNLVPHRVLSTCSTKRKTRGNSPVGGHVVQLWYSITR